MVRLAVLLLVGSCSFDPGRADTPTDAPATPDPDGATDGTAPDSPPPVHDADHVPSDVDAAFAGTADVTLADATIDTGTSGMPTSSVQLPNGARFVVTPQDGGGPELAVLEVGSLNVTGTLRVIGGRPLVVVAATTITVDVIDASAVADAPGAGGAGPRQGSGGGGDGGVSGSADAGGGGGGFGTAGAAGQSSGAATGAAGPAYGSAMLTTLEGGSGGGRSAPACQFVRPGAGGGAIQLSADTSITITGSVRANGGGGAGGIDCNNTGTSGAGGGSGGAIYLQAPSIAGAGLLLAQGGGGGGGSDVSQQTFGQSGDDGPDTIAAASGGSATGTGVNGEDNTGGAGGYRDADPPALTALSGSNSGNGGGGGGGVGRIAIHSGQPGTLGASPQATTLP